MARRGLGGDGCRAAFGPPTNNVPFLGSTEIVETIDLPKPTATGGEGPAPAGIQLTNAEVFTGRAGATIPGNAPGLVWDHLIYAYLIESTGVFEVMAEVLRRYAVGETLNPLSPKGMRWARTTEELFYRDPPLYAIHGVVSELRPDQRVSRRNAYWRMFGFEPPHPIPERWARPGLAASSWRLDTGDGVNLGFREKWTELLRQLWLGIENANNGIGPNATDREYVALLCNALRDMLAMRRRRGLLAREEFVYVTTLSWFHLTVETNSPIVVDLNADGPDPADRLAKIAQRVGLTPAARSRELFQLADLMSSFLRAIELGLFATGATAELLYRNLGTNGPLVEDVNRIIDLWQSATGDRVKEPVGGRIAQPVRVPDPSAPPTLPPVPATGPSPVAPRTPSPALVSRNGSG